MKIGRMLLSWVTRKKLALNVLVNGVKISVLSRRNYINWRFDLRSVDAEWVTVSWRRIGQRRFQDHKMSFELLSRFYGNISRSMALLYSYSYNRTEVYFERCLRTRVFSIGIVQKKSLFSMMEYRFIHNSEFIWWFKILVIFLIRFIKFIMST